MPSVSVIELSWAANQLDQNTVPADKKEEEGTPLQWLGVIVCSLAAVLLSLLFHRAFFSGYGMDALDNAQLARNISQGRGFATDFIRPFLLSQFSIENEVSDFSNPPLYPFLLACTFAILGKTDGAILFLSVSLLALSAALLFVLARRLTHNVLTACLAVSAYLLSPSVLATVDSGRPLVLSTCLLLILLLALIPFQRQTHGDLLGVSSREPSFSQTGARFNFWVGFLVGLCYLSDYFSLLYVVPIVAVMKRNAGTRIDREATPTPSYRGWYIAVGATVVVFPWLWRNFILTGNPFYSTQWLEVVMDTQRFPNWSLLRETSHAALWSGIALIPVKFVRSLAAFLLEIPFLPNVYLMPFVVCAFWVPFNAPRMNRFKTAIWPALGFYILGLCLLGRSPMYLLALIPLLALLGTAAYVRLASLWLRKLDEYPESAHRSNLRGFAPALALIMPLGFLALPLAWQLTTKRNLAPNKVDPIVWFQSLNDTVEARDKRAIATDIPWAAAWYARKRAVWLPNALSQLAAVERKQPLAAIYLSPELANANDVRAHQAWLGPYQATQELEGFERISRPIARDVIFVKRPSQSEVLKMVRSQPNNPASQLLLAQMQLDAGNYTAALQTFGRLRRLQPVSPYPYWGIGKAYIGLKSPGKALSAFTQALKYADSVPELKIDMQMQSADILTKQGNQKGGASLYEAVLADDPNNQFALNNLAYIYATDQRDLNRALELARRASEQAPNNGRIRDTLGWVCLLMNRPQEAVLHLREAVRLAPKSAMAHLHLGQALVKIGQKREATQYLKTSQILSRDE